MPTYDRHDIYADILHKLNDNGHNVYSISSNQRRNGKATTYKYENGIHALRVKTGNITQCGMIEKGISTIMIKYQYISAIKKYFADIKFDLILYATPPITLADVVKYVKRRDNAKAYLMLKDIFPQNAVDLGMMTKYGFKGLIYKAFRYEEKKLYTVSDKIGAMSQANVDYILSENQELDKSQVEIFPNCIDPIDLRVEDNIRSKIRNKYHIPLDKVVFVYGGNLGKPQGIPFIIETLKAIRDMKNIFFLIVGDGTEYGKLEKFISSANLSNVSLMKKIPKNDYDRLVAACDVGLIYLDYRFKIPNFPSRLLSYMQAGLPVLAATDPNTDIGKTIVDGEFGWWCESNDISTFKECLNKAAYSDRKQMGINGYNYLLKNYDISVGYNKLINFMNK